MIFQHTLDKVLSGEKTQTRRIQKAGQWALKGEWDTKLKDFPTIAIVHESRTLYEVGSTYAVQGGRGQKGIARILITDIRAEDVRNISDDDVKAEGFASHSEFNNVWCAMYEPKILLCEMATEGADPSNLRQYLMNHSIYPENYQAWAITFKLVGGEA